MSNRDMWPEQPLKPPQAAPTADADSAVDLSRRGTKQRLVELDLLDEAISNGQDIHQYMNERRKVLTDAFNAMGPAVHGADA